MGFMTPDSLIVVIVFLPLVGSLLALATGYQPRLCRWVSLSLTLIELALISLLFCLNLKPQAGPTGVWLLASVSAWMG